MLAYLNYKVRFVFCQPWKYLQKSSSFPIQNGRHLSFTWLVGGPCKVNGKVVPWDDGPQNEARSISHPQCSTPHIYSHGPCAKNCTEIVINFPLNFCTFSWRPGWKWPSWLEVFSRKTLETRSINLPSFPGPVRVAKKWSRFCSRSSGTRTKTLGRD